MQPWVTSKMKVFDKLFPYQCFKFKFTFILFLEKTLEEFYDEDGYRWFRTGEIKCVYFNIVVITMYYNF